MGSLLRHAYLAVPRQLPGSEREAAAAAAPRRGRQDAPWAALGGGPPGGSPPPAGGPSGADVEAQPAGLREPLLASGPPRDAAEGGAWQQQPEQQGRRGRRGAGDWQEQQQIGGGGPGPSSPPAWSDEQSAAAGGAWQEAAAEAPGGLPGGGGGGGGAGASVVVPGLKAAGGSAYAQRYLFLAAWLAALLGAYAVQRGLCRFGLPHDCVAATALEAFSDVGELCLFGGALGWMAGLTEAARFAWLFSRRRWYVWATLAGTPLVYSLISNVPGLDHSFVDVGRWGAAFIALEAASMAAIAAVVAWHLWVAKQTYGRADLAAYAASRLSIFAFFVAQALVLHRSRRVAIHLHHLYIGWALALWAEFSRPLSGAALAAGAGIFAQGVAAYSFAPVFLGGDCFETPAAAQASCKFWAAHPFSLRVCPAAGALPSHSCAT